MSIDRAILDLEFTLLMGSPYWLAVKSPLAFLVVAFVIPAGMWFAASRIWGENSRRTIIGVMVVLTFVEVWGGSAACLVYLTPNP